MIGWILSVVRKGAYTLLVNGDLHIIFLVVRKGLHAIEDFKLCMHFKIYFTLYI